MDKQRIAARHRELSAKQAAYVANRAKGMPRDQSAIMAGYADSENVGAQVEESPAVQAALAEARADTAKAVGVTKDDVARGLIEAAGMAKTLADPSAMVRAYAELGKLLGYYAPEVKKVEHNLGAQTLEAMERMSDADLLRIAHGRVIEGVATEVKE